MARRPGVLGSGGYSTMKIGEATRLAMATDAPPGRPTPKPAPSGIADLEQQTNALLAAIRGPGSMKAKLSRTDSSIKTEEMEMGDTRKVKKKRSKKGKSVGPPREAFVRVKTPPSTQPGPGFIARTGQYARATVELPDDDSTPRSLGSEDDRSLPDSDREGPAPTLTEPQRARLAAEEEAIRDLDFRAEEARVRDDADQFVPTPGMTRDELDREAARLRAAEAKKMERRRLESDGTGTRAARKRAYAEQEAATKIQSVMRGRADRERARKFKIEMEKAYERAWRSGQINQEVIDPTTGDVYILNTDARTYVRTGAVSKLPSLSQQRPPSEKGKRVRGGPAPRLEQGKPQRGTAAASASLDDPSGSDALAELERSVNFADAGSIVDDEEAVDHSSLIPGFRMARPGGVSAAVGRPQAATVPATTQLPRIVVPAGGQHTADAPTLDSPADTMSTARSAVVDVSEPPAVGTTAASLRTTVQNALKYVCSPSPVSRVLLMGVCFPQGHQV